MASKKSVKKKLAKKVIAKKAPQKAAKKATTTVSKTVSKTVSPSAPKQSPTTASKKAPVAAPKKVVSKAPLIVENKTTTEAEKKSTNPAKNKSKTSSTDSQSIGKNNKSSVENRKTPPATDLASKQVEKSVPKKATATVKVSSNPSKSNSKGNQKQDKLAKKSPIKKVVKKVTQKKAEESSAKEPIANEIPLTQEEQTGPDYSNRPDPMYVIHITPEMAPVAKVGGLGDVVSGLGRETEIRGNTVEYILPKYDCMRYDHVYCMDKCYEDLFVPWYGGAIACDVWAATVHGRRCFLIEPKSHDNFFNRGKYYGDRDDIYRYAFFSRAALEFIYKSGKSPEIIHCHDWQTGLVPVLLFEIYQHIGLHHPRVCYTVHNFKHQGVTGENVLHAVGLGRPEYFMHHDRLHDNCNPKAVNLMKAGIVYSNFVTTVSMKHATEAKDGDQGYGLGHSLQVHHQKFGGILNGVDYDVWNPEIDPLLPHKYSVDAIEGKYSNKSSLRQRLLLEDNEKPIISYVGRLDTQKGLDLILHSIYQTINNGCQFILLGSSPDHSINENFWRIKHELNENPNVHLEIGFNEELAHLIYAGSDMMIVPSHFEPCGLTQLIALRYGTVPIVRSVGGLADTVFDKDYCDYKSPEERNGFVFQQADVAGINSAMDRAIGLYYNFPEDFRKLMQNGMRYDYSWNHPGEHYVNIYAHIRN